MEPPNSSNSFRPSDSEIVLLLEASLRDPELRLNLPVLESLDDDGVLDIKNLALKGSGSQDAIYYFCEQEQVYAFGAPISVIHPKAITPIIREVRNGNLIQVAVREDWWFRIGDGYRSDNWCLSIFSLTPQDASKDPHLTKRLMKWSLLPSMEGTSSIQADNIKTHLGPVQTPRCVRPHPYSTPRSAPFKPPSPLDFLVQQIQAIGCDLREVGDY